MHLDPLLPVLTKIALLVLLVGLVMRRLKQPYIVGYLIAGILLGPFALGLITNIDAIGHLGALGVVLLLFFVGMEMSISEMQKSWKIALLGTIGQILASLLAIYMIGLMFDWPLPRIILIGFVISLSSTAVVIRLLQEWGEMETPVGRNVVGVLLAQDLLVIPMLIVLGLLGSGVIEVNTIIKQVLGGIVLVGVVLWAIRKSDFRIPLISTVKGDQESRIYAAMILCLGLSYISGLLELSTALGAFCAGIIVSAAKESDWVHHSLHPFYIVFVATFFVSVGLLLDLEFLANEYLKVIALVVLTLILNTAINATVLRLLGVGWQESLYSGAILAQVGEFSFVLASVGYEANIIEKFGYQLTMSVIALSLLVSPMWTSLARKILITPSTDHSG